LEQLDKFYFGFLFFTRIFKARRANQAIEATTYAKVFAFTSLCKPDLIEDYETVIDNNINDFQLKWPTFFGKGTSGYKQLRMQHVEKLKGKRPKKLKGNWMDSQDFIKSVKNDFVNVVIEQTDVEPPKGVGA